MPRYLFTFIISCFCAHVIASISTVEITSAWVNESPPGIRVNAAYMNIVNNGEANVVLTGARSPDFSHVEFHETVIEEDTTRMQKLDEIAIPAGTAVALTPGSLHMMLIGTKSDIAAGSYVTVTLIFSGGSERSILLPVHRKDYRQHSH